MHEYEPITDADVDTILETLPSGLDETYDRMLHRINKRKRPVAIRILTWVAFAPDPMSLAAVAEAAAVLFTSTNSMDDGEGVEVDYSKFSYQKSDQFGDCEDLLKLLPGLLEVREDYRGRKIVFLFHFSFLDYLVSEEIFEKDPAIQAFALERTTVRLQLADACFRFYLYESLFKDGDRVNEHFRSKEWSSEEARQSGFLLADALTLDRWPASLRRLIAKVVAIEIENDLSPVKMAINYTCPELLKFILEEKPEESNLCLREREGEESTISVLNYMCERNSGLQMVKVALSHGADPFTKDDKYHNSIDAYLVHFNGDMLEELLQTAKILAQCEVQQYSPLIAAITMPWTSHISLHRIESRRVRKLFQWLDMNQQNIFPNSFEPPEEGVIYDMGDFRSVTRFFRLLINLVPDNLQTFGLPALQTAIVLRRSYFIDALVSAGWDLKVRDPLFGNSLQCAVAVLHVSSIELLLKKGAKMDSEGPGWEDLIAIVEEGSCFDGGPKDGKLAAARLRVAQRIFGSHRPDKKDTPSLMEFGRAITLLENWSKEVRVSWERLRAWDGQVIPPFDSEDFIVEEENRETYGFVQAAA
jgi:hypothetical protein